jgi:hypothetical protein
VVQGKAKHAVNVPVDAVVLDIKKALCSLTRATPPQMRLL